jgi:hypothetical protein
VKEDGTYRYGNNDSHHLEQRLSNWRDLTADWVESDISNIRTSINEQCNIKMYIAVNTFLKGEKKFRFYYGGIFFLWTDCEFGHRMQKVENYWLRGIQNKHER